MQGKAHIATGVAASLAVLHPATLGGCFAAVIGGAVGGGIPDIDQPPSNVVRDALHGRVIVSTLVAAMLVADYLTHAGICDYVAANAGPRMVLAAAALVALCAVGYASKHRTFTHSLLFGALSSQALWYVCPALAMPFAIGFASHLVLDLLNYQKLQLLWPLEQGRCSLGLCHAKGLVNTLLTLVGAVAAIVLFVWRVWVSLHV